MYFTAVKSSSRCSFDKSKKRKTRVAKEVGPRKIAMPRVIFFQGKRRASIVINHQVQACRKVREKTTRIQNKKGNANHLCQDHIPGGAIFSILAKVLF
jgi:hypothetical protein